MRSRCSVRFFCGLALLTAVSLLTGALRGATIGLVVMMVVMLLLVLLFFLLLGLVTLLLRLARSRCRGGNVSGVVVFMLVHCMMRPSRVLKLI